MLLNLPRQCIEIAGTLMTGQRLPCGKRLTGSLNRRIYISSIGLRNFGYLVASRGIVRREVFA